MHRIPVAVRENEGEVDRYRRLMGAGLGAALGLVYFLVSQGINLIFLPDIPLFQPPLGLWGNAALGALWGGLLGLICAWPYSTAIGVVLASIASISVNVVRGLAGIDEPLGRLVIIAMVLGVPTAILMIPAMMALRWAINGFVDLRSHPTSRRERWRSPLILLALIAVVAAFSLYNAKARTLLVRMNDTLQAGLAAASAADLPGELQTLRSGNFLANASDSYTLEWTETDLDRFIDLRPSSNYSDHSAVLVRFDNGRSLVCLYPTVDARPNCAIRAVPSAIPPGVRFLGDM
jgi:hypothetical protein